MASESVKRNLQGRDWPSEQGSATPGVQTKRVVEHGLEASLLGPLLKPKQVGDEEETAIYSLLQNKHDAKLCRRHLSEKLKKLQQVLNSKKLHHLESREMKDRLHNIKQALEDSGVLQRLPERIISERVFQTIDVLADFVADKLAAMPVTPSSRAAQMVLKKTRKYQEITDAIAELKRSFATVTQWPPAKEPAFKDVPRRQAETVGLFLEDELSGSTAPTDAKSYLDSHGLSSFVDSSELNS